MIVNDQLMCQLINAVKTLACKVGPDLTEGFGSCLEVTVQGNWGDVGDRIQEIKWFNVSKDNPELTNTIWFNRNKQQWVTGITADNTIPCIDDLPAVVSVSNFPDVYETTPVKSDTATIDQVEASTSSVILRAANSNRLGLSIQNDSVSVLYVSLNSVASSNNYSAKVQPDGYYEVPFNYTGDVSGIWVTATGDAFVTEFE